MMLLWRQATDTSLGLDAQVEALNKAKEAAGGVAAADNSSIIATEKRMLAKLKVGDTSGFLSLPGHHFSTAEIDKMKTDLENQMASDAFKSEISQKGAEVGESFLRGIIEGTNNLRDTLRAALEELAVSSIMGPLKTALGIASPSKAGMWIGSMFTQGVMLGMGGGRAALPALAGVGGGGSGGGMVSHTYNTYHISAIDTQSFAQAVDRNHLVIGAAAAQAVDKNAGIRRAIRGS
jgi:hypothetical protein